jgi:hypothetical protein
VADHFLGTDVARGRLQATSPPTYSAAPFRATIHTPTTPPFVVPSVLITPLQLFPLTDQTASPTSVASAGDSTVIIEESLASATLSDLDTRQFRAPQVQPNTVAPQDLQPCSRVSDLESEAKLQDGVPTLNHP